KVVVIVGAGITIDATSASYASWPGLLKHGVEYLVTTEALTGGRGRELNNSLDEAFSPFDLKRALQHAEFVEQSLRTPDHEAFTNWLRTAFEPLKAKAGRTATLDAIGDLQRSGA